MLDNVFIYYCKNNINMSLLTPLIISAINVFFPSFKTLRVNDVLSDCEGTHKAGWSAVPSFVEY